MNNIGLKLIACLLIAISLVGCGSNEIEPKLIGSWVYTYTDNSDGEEVKMTLRLNLKESNELKFDVGISMESFSNIATASTVGTWRVDNETLHLDIDDKFDIKMGAGMEFLADLADMDISEFEREFLNEVLEPKELSGLVNFKIQKIDSEVLVLDDGGLLMPFMRESGD